MGSEEYDSNGVSDQGTELMKSEIVLLDGPVGTELHSRGIDTSLAWWSAQANVTAGEVVSQIHRDYCDAGATVHTANTFRTQRRYAGDCWREWTTVAVDLVRRSVDVGNLIAGSLAPLEDCYRPDLSPVSSYEEHLEMAEMLAGCGCDLILCETFACGREALEAVQASIKAGLPVWVALTAGPNGDLMSPAEMAGHARACVDAGAEAVLVNCVPASKTLEFVEALAGASLAVPFGAYANAGSVDEGIGWAANASHPLRSSAAYLGYAQRWIEAGATLIGGCCGTSPHHIQAVHDWLHESPS